MTTEEKVERALELYDQYSRSSGIELRGEILQLLLSATEEGSPRAPGILGDFYYSEMNIVDRDNEKGWEYYELAASRGDGYGLYMMYIRESVHGDHLKATEYLYRSAEAGTYPYSMLIYGESLYHLDIVKGLEWVKKAAEKGCNIAYIVLAAMTRYQPYVKDRNQSFIYLQKAIECGGYVASEAYYLMGYYYDFGVGTKVNHREARKYYKLAIKAEMYEEEAMGMIGRHYIRGLGGLKKDLDKGIKLILTAIKKEACTSDIYLELANCYQNGVGVKKNLRLAKQYEVLAKKAEEEFYRTFINRMMNQ